MTQTPAPVAFGNDSSDDATDCLTCAGIGVTKREGMYGPCPTCRGTGRKAPRRAKAPAESKECAYCMRRHASRGRFCSDACSRDHVLEGRR